MVLSSSTYQYSSKSSFNYPEREVHIDEALFRGLLRAAPNTTTTNNTNQAADLMVTLVNDPDSEGNTPLHLAASAWLERSIAILLHLGADPLARRNQDGNTPAHLAAEIVAARPGPHITDGNDDGVIAEALAMQDRVMTLLFPTPTLKTQRDDGNDNEPRNDAWLTPRDNHTARASIAAAQARVVRQGAGAPGRQRARAGGASRSSCRLRRSRTRRGGARGGTVSVLVGEQQGGGICCVLRMSGFMGRGPSIGMRRRMERRRLWGGWIGCFRGKREGKALYVSLVGL
jgi:hypothetical protein